MSCNNKFIAIKLPETLLDKLCILVHELENEDSNFKGVSKEYLHMTLAFFGEKLNHLKKNQRILVQKYLEDLNSELHEIEFKFPKLIRFPPGKQNLYALEYTIKNDFLYQKIKQDLDQYLDGEVYQKWQPHITLGKTRNLEFKLTKNVDNLEFKSSKVDVIGRFL
jgi:2'-5' RNA ligase